MNTYILLVSGLVFEFLAVYFAVELDIQHNEKTLCAHLLGAALLAAGLIKTLPQRYRSPLGWVFLFFWLLFVLVPFIAPLGAFLSIYLALHMPRVTRLKNWDLVDEPGLPYKPTDFDEYPIYSHGGLVQILNDCRDPDKRLLATMTLKQLPKKEAAKHLRGRLKDPYDDIRLLAYSMLDKQGKQINERIREYREKIETATSEKRKCIYHRLVASEYWELIYLDLVQGGVYSHVLGEALAHATKSLEIEQTGPCYKLYGQILLKKGDYEQAMTAFEKASALGLSISSVSSYMAEAAFLAKEYKKVTHFLSHNKDLESVNEKLAQSMEYWL